MVNRTALQNLTRFDRIVNPDGTPSELFMRILQGKNELTATLQDEVDNLLAIEIDTTDPIHGGPFIFANFVKGTTSPYQLTHTVSGVTAGVYGDATHVSQITVDAKGHITLAANVAITGLLTDGDKGDIVVSGGGTVWTIDTNVVTFTKLVQASAASVIIGRGSAAGAGNYQEITLGTGLSMSGTVLSSTVTGLTDGDKGDIVLSSSGTVWTIDTNVVTFAKMVAATAGGVLIGRRGGSTGNFEQVSVGSGLAIGTGSSPALTNVNRRNFIAMLAGTALASGEILLAITPVGDETLTFAGNMANSTGKKMTGGTNPGSTFTGNINKNNSSVGTWVISTSGVVSFTTTSGAAISIAPGDILEFAGPSTVSTALGFMFSFAATASF